MKNKTWALTTNSWLMNCSRTSQLVLKNVKKKNLIKYFL